MRTSLRLFAGIALLCCGLLAGRLMEPTQIHSRLFETDMPKMLLKLIIWAGV